MDLFATKHPFTTDAELSTSAFWGRTFAERDRTFSRLRAEAPVAWFPPIEVPYEHGQQGFWAVTRAADITTVSMNNDIFGSRHGTTLDPENPELTSAGTFFLGMDPPDHSRYRGLVSKAFTPKAIRRISDQIQTNAEEIVDSLIGAGEIDFVTDVAARLPLITVSDIVGIPESERARFCEAAEILVGGGKAFGKTRDEFFALAGEQLFYLYAIAAQLAGYRRENPGDDLMTNLVQAEIDGHRLTDDDIGAFLVLFSVAGNDTTKQTTTHTMLALRDNPDQRAWLLEDFDGRILAATEEFVRYATPVMQFTRTALRDTELNGAQIAAGDKVALFYCSGNRDESVFPDPHRFDLTRPRTPHVGFGGGGAHFCLGNGVAKTQLRAILGQLLTRLPNIEFGEPVQLRSNFINGISSLPANVG